MGKRIDLNGKKFGRWTVTTQHRVNSIKKIEWFCICRCGNKKFVSSASLLNQTSTSCGCWRKLYMHAKHTKHGKSTHQLHRLWRGIKDRCLNKRSHNYRLYGGRGIEIYKNWKQNFIAFYNYVVTNLGLDHPGLSIDRIDTNGHYAPGNLRWATKQQQRWNTRGFTGKYKGVSKIPSGKYIAQIAKNNIKYYLGVHLTPEAAALAYNLKAKELFGSYAFLNKLDE